MVSGLKTLHSIDRAIIKARGQVSGAAKLPARISGALMDVRREQAAALGSIARLRLELIGAGHAEDDLGYVDRQAAKLLAAHADQEARMALQAQKYGEQVSALETARRTQEMVVEKAVLAYDKAALACQKKLLKDAGYLDKITEVETLEATIERAIAKLELAREDEKTKGAPYREDAFFSYLQKRNFGQEDARGWALTKLLDRWIARLCGYQTAAVNYRRLRAIPLRLEGHAETLEMRAETARLALGQIEADMLVSEGVTGLRKTSLTEQARLEKLDAKIEAAEDELAGAQSRQSALTSGAAGPYQDAIKLLSDTLARKDVPSLRVLASRTRSGDDDRAVARIANLRVTGRDLENDQRDASALLSKYQHGLRELEAVRRRFKQRRYDAPYSQFPSNGSGGNLLGGLLGQVLMGVMSGNDFWRQLERAQRTVQRGRGPDIDFGGIDWEQAMRLPRAPQRRGRRRSSGSIFGSGRSGGFGGGSRPRMPRPRAPRIKLPRGGGGGFKTGRRF